MVGWLADPGVFVASGVGVVPRQSWRLQLQVLHRLLSRVPMLRQGGAVAVMLMLVALLMLMVRMLPAELWVLAPLVMPIARALQVMLWWMVLLVML